MTREFHGPWTEVARFNGLPRHLRAIGMKRIQELKAERGALESEYKQRAASLNGRIDDWLEGLDSLASEPAQVP